MTFQVAMIADDGWLLVSDERALLQGGGLFVRATFDTPKIRYDLGVASAPFGDPCALIVRDRIIEELKPDPRKMSDEKFHRDLERRAEKVWRMEYKSQRGKPSQRLSPSRDRGVIFLSRGSKTIFILQIGKTSSLAISTTKYIGGDLGNPARFFTECYYDKARPVAELVMLAAYSVTMANKFNQQMISGLQVLRWQDGAEHDSEADWLDASEYLSRSKMLQDNMAQVIESALKG